MTLPAMVSTWAACATFAASLALAPLRADAEPANGDVENAVDEIARGAP